MTTHEQKFAEGTNAALKTKLDYDELKKLINRIEYPGFEFVLRTTGDYFYLQVKCDDICNVTGEPMQWTGRKWLLSQWMTDGEVVQTAFLAVKTAIEHETRENFKFDGQTIFDPHYDIHALVDFRSDEDVIKGRDDG